MKRKPVIPSASPLTLHVDVDAFFASVEQVRIPRLRGRAVLVGTGVIASCSYEARRFGCTAGMPLRQARRLCPAAVVLDGDYPTYRCFAEHVWDVCRRYTCGLETYLDEAYGDATGMPMLRRAGPEALGRRLQEDVAREVGLPVSVGLGANRLLAKVASAAAKPGGVRWIPPQQAEAYLAALPVEKLPGVGPKTRQQLADMNVYTVAALRRLGRGLLAGLFGRRGEVLYERSRGRDPQPLRPDAPPRSISRETTFHRPTCDGREVRGMLAYLLQRAMRTVRQADLLAGRVELALRYEDGKRYAARRTLGEPTDEDEPAFSAVEALLGRLHTRRVALRNVGVVLSGFRRRGDRGELFTPTARRRSRQLHTAVDAIRDRWGHGAIVSGRAIDLLGHLDQNNYGFILRTPSLTK